MSENKQAQEATSQEILRLGQDSDFWRLMLVALEKCKENLRNISDSDDFKDLPADRYKLESELSKAKIKYLDKLSNLPGSLIVWMKNPDNKDKDFDPYD
ncbi:hypothetical protein KAJ89_03280 [Candidatus Parcubacteria bacterium]|nr:hypothetical protein [Candidatus Parcubacteria bacterium]